MVNKWLTVRRRSESLAKMYYKGVNREEFVWRLSTDISQTAYFGIVAKKYQSWAEDLNLLISRIQAGNILFPTQVEKYSRRGRGKGETKKVKLES